LHLRSRLKDNQIKSKDTKIGSQQSKKKYKGFEPDGINLTSLVSAYQKPFLNFLSFEMNDYQQVLTTIF